MVKRATGISQRPPPVDEHSPNEPFASDIAPETREHFEEYACASHSSQLVTENMLSGAVVNLNGSQRQNRLEVDRELLYKELKHQHANTLERFIIFILCTLVPSFFFHGTGMTSIQWLIVSFKGQFRAIGIFVMCEEGVANICLNHGSSLNSLTLFESVTTEDACGVSRKRMWYYIAFIRILAITGLAFVAITLLLVIRVARRPTRHKTTLAAMCTIAVVVACGIATSVLFHYYAQCQGRACEALHLGDDCTVRYEWGYEVHVAATALDFVSFILCACLYTYPHSFRTWAQKMLKDRQERLDHARRRAAAMDTAGRRETHKKSNRNLTAADLGMEIEGANAEDWVYDVLSDYFYCFELDAFWDPLSREYYCRTLQIWQTTPDGLDVHVNLIPS